MEAVMEKETEADEGEEIAEARMVEREMEVRAEKRGQSEDKGV